MKKYAIGKGCGGPIKINNLDYKITGFGQETPTGIKHKCPNNEESQFVKDFTRVMIPIDLGGGVNKKI